VVVTKRKQKQATSAAKPILKPFIPSRIVSGGQTGVDRAGLEVAIALGIGHGGWCPKGRLSEDGSVPSRYELVENDSVEYKVRTAQNVADSDATLILHERPLSGGTLLTKRVAARLGKPHACFRITAESAGAIAQWLSEVRPEVLNVAGPRNSSDPGIEGRATELLMRALTLSS
jgi:hypothetical protein